MGTYLSFGVTPCLWQLIVLKDETFAELVIFYGLVSVKKRVGSTKEVQVVVVVPVVVEVCPWLWLAEQIREVCVIAT